VLRRTLDDSFAEPIRRDITTVTTARLCVNALFRYVGPFLAVIADGLDVSVAELGVALTIAQVCGFAAPAIGRLVDHLPRRHSIPLGLGGCALGGVVVATCNGIVWFTVGLLTISAFNIVLVVGTGAWIADHVPFAQSGRVVGLNETSWALGLLIGVSAMGLVTAATSWRWAYAAAALAAGVVLVVVLTRLDDDRADEPTPSVTTPPEAVAGSMWSRVPATGWLAIVGVVGLLAASESLFVTFGPWLQDEFDVGDAVLAGTTFALGAVELSASGLSMARTDRWGKERSVVGGSIVMILAALMLLTVDEWAVPGMALVLVFIGAFEFSIVSLIPIGAELVPGLPGRGLGLLMAAATMGRAITTIPTTWLYDHVGIEASAALAAGWATLAGVVMAVRVRSIRRPAMASSPYR
jgi:predicted MFS family arabinose efflux permease